MDNMNDTVNGVDRLAITSLVNAYARCADTRDTAGQLALFTSNARFFVYYDPKAEVPTQAFYRQADLRPVFEALKAYDATMHFNGQITIEFAPGNVTVHTYCLAHHLTRRDGQQQLMVAALRYEDIVVKDNGTWLFAERKLFVDWIENR